MRVSPQEKLKQVLERYDGKLSRTVLRRESGSNARDLSVIYLRVSPQEKLKQVLEVIKHPNNEKYPNQQIIIVNISEYAYLVPFIQEENEIFLKTIIPSRKATNHYLRDKK